MSSALVLFLDYDGTLVPFADSPDGASPDGALLELLGALSRRPATQVHVVSGRSRASLEAWLGGLPLGLHAEHGLWSRTAAGEPWTRADVDASWRSAVRAKMDHFASRVPGSFVEEKTCGLAWHYRLADPGLAASVGARLRAELRGDYGQELDVLEGAKVIEARPRGVDKARVVRRVLASAAPGTRIVAIGDDTTDEDMFAALPEGSESYRVGPGATGARGRLAEPEAVRSFLRLLAQR